MKAFELPIHVRWSDCDANQHVRHSAYYDYGAHARITFFNTQGFSSSRMQELGIGPILFKEECSFIKEIRLDSAIKINLLKGSIAADGSKWTLHHEILGMSNNKHAHITVHGAWMDLRKRKLISPPAELAELIDTLQDGADYVYRKS